MNNFLIKIAYFLFFMYPSQEVQSSENRDPFRLGRNIELIKENSKQLLSNVTLPSLQFVGLIKNDAVIWALLKDSAGLIVPIRQGDYIAKEKFKVIQIQSNFLILSKKNVAAQKIVSLPLTQGRRS